MPLFLHRHLEPQGELGIWQIYEDADFFLRELTLTPAEQAQLAQIKGRRNTEWLAVRYLLHRMSGREVRGECLKDEYGKPYLSDSEYHISISHSHGLAAVIGAPVPVGIDIQLLVQKIGVLAPRFMHPDELDFLGRENRLEKLHIYWGAKEAMYKAYGRRELEFKDHLKLDPFTFNPEGGETLGYLQKDGMRTTFRVHFEMIGQYVLVWVIDQTGQ